MRKQYVITDPNNYVIDVIEASNLADAEYQADLLYWDKPYTVSETINK